MKIKIRRWSGAWWNDEAELLRKTKTMFIVKWGDGEMRFNRKSGHIVGHRGHGMAGMTDPFISTTELQRLEKKC
jgi:hypothetical protein